MYTYRRHITEILQIRLNTQFNQSINRVYPLFDIVFILLSKVSTDEEQVKGCLCLTPAMLEISVKNTKETPSGVKEDVAPDNSNVTSTRQSQIVDKTSRSPSSTKVISIINEDIVVTDAEINEFNETVNNSTAAVDVSPNTEECYNIDFIDCVASVNMNDLKMLSLLDFAGHSAYYACHHIFFSPRAFFILVVDMTKELYSVATEACGKKGLIYSEWTYAGRLVFLFLRNVHGFGN